MPQITHSKGSVVVVLMAVVTATAALSLSVLRFNDEGIPCGRALGSAQRGRVAVRVEHDGASKVVAITAKNEWYYSLSVLPNMYRVTPPQHFVICQRPARTRLILTGLGAAVATLAVGLVIDRSRRQPRRQAVLVSA